MNLNFRMWLAATAFFLPVLPAERAAAQDMNAMMQQNMAFDAMMQQRMQAMQAQNAMAQQQLLQQFVQQNGPQLQADYQRYVQATGQQIPFQQFAYYHMMTQGGRNAGPALQQQQQNFQALQEANRTVQQGYNSYNQGWQQQQQQMGAAMDRYSQANRGYQNYQNPATGEVAQLPYGQPGVYQNNQGTYATDPMGNYHQVDPQGYTQEMDEYDE